MGLCIMGYTVSPPLSLASPPQHGLQDPCFYDFLRSFPTVHTDRGEAIPRSAGLISCPRNSAPKLLQRVPVPLIPDIVHIMPIDRMNLHLISDATGETINAIARATTVQFDHVDIVYHRWSLIRSRLQLHRVISGIEAEPGPVLSTLVDRALNAELEAACQRLAVPVVNVLQPVMGVLQEFIGEQAAARPGKQYVLNADYFRRIDAMQYVLAHDDGQAHPGLMEADVVLVGVSRSSKTPTCFYLANRGIKAANVPLVPNLPEPPELAKVQCPVIGLTLDARTLIEIRRYRLKMISTAANAGVVRQNGTDYIDEDAVKAELLWARRLCTSRGWPVIDVTRRSIEETAATVVELMDAWHARRAKAATASAQA
jgi:regulator of PEP synthase PpsR (kinase-PPPase family)